MNSKIKTILLTVIVSTGLLIGNFTMAAGLSVCGEVPAQGDGTAYDNYLAYQKELIVITAARDSAIKAEYDKLPSNSGGQGTIGSQTGGSAAQQTYQDKVQQIRNRFAVQDNALKKKYNICQPGDIFKQIAKIINFLIGFIGTFVTFRLIVSGFQMVMAQGSEEAIKGARSGINNALIGMVLVFAAYIIVNIIFQIAGVKNFGINPFGG